MLHLLLFQKSLQNRLGNVGSTRSDRSSVRSNVRSRLSLNSRMQRGSLRGSPRRTTQRGRNNQKGNLRGVQQGGVNTRKGISPLLKGRLGNGGGNLANRRGGGGGGGGRGRGGQRTKLNRASFGNYYDLFFTQCCAKHFAMCANGLFAPKTWGHVMKHWNPFI